MVGRYLVPKHVNVVYSLLSDFSVKILIIKIIDNCSGPKAEADFDIKFF
jgi:hypothetical protein